jgi:glycosyltransferase involved in cell wall biosynthesis
MKKSKSPKVSVVMSVYNGEKYLKEAIDSILSQTFKDFEFIIINDGSTDNSLKIIKSYKDPRIVLISRKNKGLVASLNEGIKKAKGEYIARQDADDISKKNRLKKEMHAIDCYDNVALLGSSMQVMDMRGRILHAHYVLTEDPELRAELLVRSPFAHGSVIYKKEFAIDAGLYRESHWPAEDYDLWLRISKYGKLLNFHEPLYIYRENEAGISSLNSKTQNKMKALVNKEAYKQIHRLILRKASIKKYLKMKDNYSLIKRINSNYNEIVRNYSKTLDKKEKLICLYTIALSRSLLLTLRLKRKILR